MNKKLTASFLALMLLFSGCGSDKKIYDGGDDAQNTSEIYENAVNIVLSDAGITVDGEKASQNEEDAVYTANDIVFYLEGQDFTYGEGEEGDAHSQAEADGHTVVHITKPGTYALSGSLSRGQVAVDLGDDAEDDPDAVVTLVLSGVDITCEVAPSVIFYNVYECGEKDEETASYEVDTSKAGANVIIADGTENNISGSYVAKIYDPDTVELNEDGTEVIEAKKLHKYDAAFYSKMSMNVDGGALGSGVLNIDAENEGLDTELHLTVNGGNINIESGNDGINTNEDNISVTTINGGTVDIVVTGETGEGDGIDSNGWLVINGGNVSASACSISGDAGIDSDMGIYLNGGTVMAGGNMLDQIAGGQQTYAVFGFKDSQKGGEVITLKDSNGQKAGEWAPVNDYSILIVAGDLLAPGDYTLWQGDTQLAGSAGMMGGGMRPGMMPQDGERFEMPEPNEDGTITLPDGTVIDPEDMPEPDFDHKGNMPQPHIPGTQVPKRPESDENFTVIPDEIPAGEGADKPSFGDGTFPGKGDRGQMTAAPISPIFTIKEGGNMFSGITVYEG